MATSPEAAARMRVMSVFLAQGIAGLQLMLWLTWLRQDQVAAIVHQLGDNAPIVIGVFIAFATTLALLKFELTEMIYVSLVLTAFMAFFPLLGGILTAWVAVVVSVTTRILGMKQIGWTKITVSDPRAEWIRTFGLFGTYGIPVIAASTLYESLGGEVPAMHPTPVAAMLIALCGAAMILTNQLVMFRAARAWGYSVSKIVKLDTIDSSIYFLTIPYAVVTALSYGAIGWGAVVALAFTGGVANFIARNLAIRDDHVLPKERMPLGEGLNSWVVKHHQPLLLGSTADEHRMGIRSVPDTKATESWLGVPMMARDHVIGVIAVESYKKHAFTADDVLLLTAIANQAAVALENAHLYKDLEGLTYALEQRVLDRTNELRETNLRLLAADRSKNQFLANMSHELRTPLNSIIGFSSVLIEAGRSSLPQRMHKFLENIHTAGNHLLELINDILDLSKIEAGKMELRADEFDLRETIAAVERVMRGFAAEAKVQILVNIDPKVPQVRLDEGRLKQILFNLLSNAVKFSPHGGLVAVSCRFLPRSDSPLALDTVRVDVTDQGIGIPADELQRIFVEFYQTEEGRRIRGGGTGLGLSLTRNFVELHHGRIEVKSKPSEGSTFTLYLPVDYDEAAYNPRPYAEPHIHDHQTGFRS